MSSTKENSQRRGYAAALQRKKTAQGGDGSAQLPRVAALAASQPKQSVGQPGASGGRVGCKPATHSSRALVPLLDAHAAAAKAVPALQARAPAIYLTSATNISAHAPASSVLQSTATPLLSVHSSAIGDPQLDTEEQLLQAELAMYDQRLEMLQHQKSQHAAPSASCTSVAQAVSAAAPSAAEQDATPQQRKQLCDQDQQLQNERAHAAQPAVPAHELSIVRSVVTATGTGCKDVLAAHTTALLADGACWTSRGHRVLQLQSSCILQLQGRLTSDITLRITFADAASVPRVVRLEHAPSPTSAFERLGDIHLQPKSLHQLRHLFRLGKTLEVQRFLRITLVGHMAEANSGAHRVSHMLLTSGLGPPLRPHSARSKSCTAGGSPQIHPSEHQHAQPAYNSATSASYAVAPEQRPCCDSPCHHSDPVKLAMGESVAPAPVVSDLCEAADQPPNTDADSVPTKAVENLVGSPTPASSSAPNLPTLQLCNGNSHVQEVVHLQDLELGKARPALQPPASVSSDMHIILLSLHRAKEVIDILSGLKLQPQQVQQTVLKLFDSSLGSSAAGMTQEKVNQLHACLPSPDERRVLEGYAGPVEALGTAEQFMLQMMQMPGLGQALQARCLAHDFARLARDVEAAAELLYSACQEVRDSQLLRTVLDVSLLAGNFLNAGNANGATAGFQIDALLKLKGVRSSRRGSPTLLHFVAREAARKHPDGACLTPVLPSAAAAAQIDMQTVGREMLEIVAILRHLENLIAEAEQEGSASGEQGTCMVYMVSLQAELLERRNALQVEMENAQTAFRRLGDALNGKRTTLADPTAFFGVLQAFATELDTAHRENDAADALAKEQADEKPLYSKLGKAKTPTSPAQQGSPATSSVSIVSLQQGNTPDNRCSSPQIGVVDQAAQRRQHSPAPCLSPAAVAGLGGSRRAAEPEIPGMAHEHQQQNGGDDFSKFKLATPVVNLLAESARLISSMELGLARNSSQEAADDARSMHHDQQTAADAVDALNGQFTPPTGALQPAQSSQQLHISQLRQRSLQLSPTSTPLSSLGRQNSRGSMYSSGGATPASSMRLRGLSANSPLGLAATPTAAGRASKDHVAKAENWQTGSEGEEMAAAMPHAASDMPPQQQRFGPEFVAHPLQGEVQTSIPLHSRASSFDLAFYAPFSAEQGAFDNDRQAHLNLSASFTCANLPCGAWGPLAAHQQTRPQPHAGRGMCHSSLDDLALPCERVSAAQQAGRQVSVSMPNSPIARRQRQLSPILEALLSNIPTPAMHQPAAPVANEGLIAGASMEPNDLADMAGYSSDQELAWSQLEAIQQRDAEWRQQQVQAQQQRELALLRQPMWDVQLYEEPLPSPLTSATQDLDAKVTQLLAYSGQTTAGPLELGAQGGTFSAVSDSQSAGQYLLEPVMPGYLQEGVRASRIMAQQVSPGTLRRSVEGQRVLLQRRPSGSGAAPPRR